MDTIAIIGEGITEKYYIESLQGFSPFRILPQELGKKASSLKKLEDNIKKAISDGYDKVYCLIDMDSKTEGLPKQAYQRLKSKYKVPIINKNKGINCTIKFIESERCTELWFLYHFTYITKKLQNYATLEKELKKYRPKYEKTDKYFKSIGGDIHKDLTSMKDGKIGSLKNAIKNSKSSIKSRDSDGREHTYSELHILIEELGILDHI